MLGLPLMLAALLLAGCTTVERDLPVATQLSGIEFNDADRYGARPPIPTMDELLQLTSDQQATFLAYLNDPALQRLPKNERVARYLQDYTAGFNYQGDTFDAATAFASNSGNCLSLALMTTALADLAGVRIGYQLLDDTPVFEYQGSVVQKGYHVRSILYDSKKLVKRTYGSLEVSSTGISIDYFLSDNEKFAENLSRSAFVAMYYGNIAADAIAAQDYNTAYWYARELLVHSPDDPAAINVLALASRRVGDSERADELYRYGIARADEKLSLMKNYHTLLQAEGRTLEAERIARQLEAMDDPSPFHWLQLARVAAEGGELDSAIRYYRRALALAPYMHEAYLGLAQSQSEAGMDTAAITSLRKALANAYRPDTRKLYKAKLYSLTNGKS